MNSWSYASYCVPVNYGMPCCTNNRHIPYETAGIREFFLTGDTRIAVFSSDERSFCVTATLVIRNRKALLIDAKFNKSDPHKIIRYLQCRGIALTDIFISHGDPDYYFGLEEIKAAYPHVIARTTPSVARHITNTVWNKLVVWSDALQNELPQNIVLPAMDENSSFVFEGLHFDVFGSDRTRISLYAPALGLVVGGPSIVSGNHLFLADMSREEDRARWRNNLVEILRLAPQLVIPGHSDLDLETFDRQSIDFSIAYLDKVAEILPTAPTSDAFIAQMLETYPDLKSYDVLVLSARVLTGEMQWE